MHDHQNSGSSVVILGLIVHPNRSLGRCKSERLTLVKQISSDWLSRFSSGQKVSAKEIMQVSGLWFFISEMFQIGRPDLVHFFKLRTKASKIAERTNLL